MLSQMKEKTAAITIPKADEESEEEEAEPAVAVVSVAAQEPVCGFKFLFFPANFLLTPDRLRRRLRLWR